MNMEPLVQQAWHRGKFLLKGLVIAGLVIFLLLPAHFVENLVREREDRQQLASREMRSKWAGQQLVAGPLVVLPFMKAAAGNPGGPREKHFAYFLPDEIEIRADVTPHEKYRGIYKVMLYNAQLHLKGSFGEIDPARLGIAAEDVLWKEAFVQFGLGDIRGLKEELRLRFKNDSLHFSAGVNAGTSDGDLLVAPLSSGEAQDLAGAQFAGELSINGSERLLFAPVGRSTSLTILSKWPHPSFTGSQLPNSSEVTSEGFEAKWTSLAHSRRFPQQWVDNDYHIGGVAPPEDNAGPGEKQITVGSANSGAAVNSISTEAFGVDIYAPVNVYQQTMRSVKYAILCILLTFASFFIIELVSKRSIHPFQYGLVGLALVLFYTLLLSFSEYTGFPKAYLLAAAATIFLIGWFVKGILQSTRFSLILMLVLVLLYAYLFTTLQLQDYSLILGSIGLFLTLAVVMQFSKKIQW